LDIRSFSFAIFTTKVGSNVSLLAIPAAPDSETVSVEKESPGLPTILAAHRLWTNAEETTVPYMGA
jgi:hypothetical protein